MEYVILGLAIALVGVKFWLDEKKEKRHHSLICDLINKKMARDFYDYVYGTETLKKADNPQLKLFKEIEEQIRNNADKGKTPEFINQRRNFSEIPQPKAY